MTSRDWLLRRIATHTIGIYLGTVAALTADSLSQLGSQGGLWMGVAGAVGGLLGAHHVLNTEN